MAITPGYQPEMMEEEYTDKGAVMMPQINPETDRKYQEAKAQALATDKVEWPTKVDGITSPLN